MNATALLTPARLDALEEAARAATPGERYYDGRDIFTVAFRGDGGRLLVPLPETWHESQRVPDADARYIAACDPETILALIEVARPTLDPRQGVTVPTGDPARAPARQSAKGSGADSRAPSPV